MTPDEALEAMARCDYWNGRQSLSAPDRPPKPRKQDFADMRDFMRASAEWAETWNVWPWGGKDEDDDFYFEVPVDPGQGARDTPSTTESPARWPGFFKRVSISVAGYMTSSGERVKGHSQATVVNEVILLLIFENSSEGMMSEMILRVEAALAEVIADRGNQKLASAFGLFLAEHKGELGRAAITAMREPTVAMVEGVSHLVEGDSAVIYTQKTYDIWRGMIDAALSRFP